MIEKGGITFKGSDNKVEFLLVKGEWREVDCK